MPVGGAHLTVNIAELKPLDHTNGFLDVAAHTVVVDVDVTDLLVGIDQEQTAERLSVVQTRHILVVHSVSLHGVSGHVRQQRKVHETAQTTLRTSSLQPAQMREGRVTRDSEHNRVDGSELIGGIAVGEELRGADEGPVHGVEQQDNPLALVGVKGHIGEGVVSLSAVEAKVGSSLTNRNRHYLDEIEKRMMERRKRPAVWCHSSLFDVKWSDAIARLHPFPRTPFIHSSLSANEFSTPSTAECEREAVQQKGENDSHSEQQ